MKATGKNSQLKALIKDVSKTIEMYTNEGYLKGAVRSALSTHTFSQNIRDLKAWNKETMDTWFGEKNPQTDLGDQFIF
jgi:hypothetical protein